MHRCSFLTHSDPPPLNPLYRDGINPAEVGLTIKKDPTQQAAASIIEQVAQVTLFRVVIPWMIGKAFERVGDEEFMQLVQAKLNDKKEIPGPVLKELDPVLERLLKQTFADKKFDELLQKRFPGTSGLFKLNLPKFQELIHELFQDDEFVARVGQGIPFGDILQPSVQREVGPKVQDAVADTFSNYNFKAKTWAGLTKNDPNDPSRGTVSKYEEEGGLPKRGALRFRSSSVVHGDVRVLLVLTVGWMFVFERRLGGRSSAYAAPLTKASSFGKFLPAWPSAVPGCLLAYRRSSCSGLRFGPSRFGSWPSLRRPRSRRPAYDAGGGRGKRKRRWRGLDARQLVLAGIGDR